MQTEATIGWGQNQDRSVETIELDPPGQVLVEPAAPGMCHSDD